MLSILIYVVNLGFLAFSVVFYCCDLLKYVENITRFFSIFNYLSFLIIPISLFFATHILFNDLLKYVFKPKQRQAYSEEVRMNQPIFENNTHRYNENIDPIDTSNVRVTFRINNSVSMSHSLTTPILNATTPDNKSKVQNNNRRNREKENMTRNIEYKYEDTLHHNNTIPTPSDSISGEEENISLPFSDRKNKVSVEENISLPFSETNIPHLNNKVLVKDKDYLPDD